nr:subtilisin-like protease SBT6.1 isoform X1 [Ipomoea batatas]GMD64238.1 subtilisin-like protease SBT6.1 isoform X1 [Ipomoea batatas]
MFKLMQADTPILGLLEVGRGRIAVYGDSNCLDSSHMVTNCYGLLKKILDFTSKSVKDPVLFSDSARQDKPLYIDKKQLPSRRTDVNFSTYSAVTGKELICRHDSRFEVWETKGYNLHVRGRNLRLPGYTVIDLGTGLNSSAESSWMKISNKTKKDVGYSPRSKDLNGDDEDVPVPLATHWLLPAVVAIIGLLLLLSLWRFRQKRHRRRRTGSSRIINP